MLDDILNQLPEDQKTEAALDAFDKKANEHTRSVDGTGTGLRAGMKLIPVDEECIEAKAYGDFATYRGREYGRVAFMDYDNNKVVFVPEGRLNFYGRVVDKKGEETGDILQPQGGPVDAWRSAGPQASLKARVIALSEAFYNEKYGRPKKECAYILVKPSRKAPIAPRPWDDDGAVSVEGEVFDFVGCDASGKEIW